MKAEGPGPLSLTTCLVARIWCFHHCYPAQSLAAGTGSTASHCRLRPPKINTLALCLGPHGKHGVSGSLMSTCRLQCNPLEQAPSWNPTTESCLRKPKKPQEGEQDLSQQPQLTSNQGKTLTTSSWRRHSRVNLATPDPPSQPTESWGITDSTVCCLKSLSFETVCFTATDKPNNHSSHFHISRIPILLGVQCTQLKKKNLCSFPLRGRQPYEYNFDQ